MKLAVVVGMIGITAVLAAQGSSPSEGTPPALVAELRALRADLNRIAGSSIRTQLLVGRLQLQEQRIVAVSSQIAAVQKDAGELSHSRAAMEAQVENMTRAATPQEQQEAERALTYFRPQLTALRQREQQLRQRESELSALLADEQARWSDFSSRLDELERALLAVRER